jgi:uncharacterized protein
MQFLGIFLVLLHGDLSVDFLGKLAWGVPAAIAGCMLGLAMFGKVNDLTFRRVVLSALLVSGLAML